MKKRERMLILLFSAVYFVSYLTRNNYGAVMLEIMNSESLTKAAASLALTVSSLTYGAGQLVSGYLGDKFKPEKIIFAGLFGATLMNLLLPVASSVEIRSVLWGINGFSQAMIWPPLVKIMSGVFDGETYKNGTLMVSIAAAVATVMVYLVSPLLIAAGSWRYVFIFSAVCGALMCTVWNIVSKKIAYRTVDGNVENDKKSVTRERFTRGAVILLGLTVFSVMLQGILRDGISMWTPTLVAETFNIDTESAILSGGILPVFTIISLLSVSVVTKKLFRDELACAGMFFVMSAVGLAFMVFSSKAVISLLGAAFAQGFIHGVNYCLTCLVPRYFHKLNRTSLVAGVINCGAYIGSSVSGVGTAALLIKMNWGGVALVWCGVAVTGTVLCLTAMLVRRKAFDKGK